MNFGVTDSCEKLSLESTPLSFIEDTCSSYLIVSDSGFANERLE
jgi:hypothetical protein